ncbi:MAG: hypothetical protein Q7S50_02625 [bacterium]|nr:hypothetical protein [bacterium]
MNIDTRIIALVILVFGIVSFGTYMWMSPSATTTTITTPTARQDVELSPEVEDVLTKETRTIEELAKDPLIISEVIASNEKDGALSGGDIARLDGEWQKSKEVTPFIQQFLSNKTAEILLAFQKINPGFKEVFVTNVYGLNVGQTDKTSDYYQADEAWWQDSFNGGAGKTLHGQIEFDESSQTEAISLYVPIIDPVSSKVIGVLKGVLDLVVIKRQL